MSITILVVCGTRPEAIKLAPLIRLLRKAPRDFDLKVCVTGQHREMLDQVLQFFEITPDIDLKLMCPNQSLPGFAAAALVGIAGVLQRLKPAYVVVQGDTTTAFVSSLAAYYDRIPVGHVEAGLRTGDRYAPFPEEVNRRFISVVASQHFAPTEKARQALLAEGVADASIQVTGNTVVDALVEGLMIVDRSDVNPEMPRLGPGRLVLVTGHRRENFGEGLRSICLALRDLANRFPGDHFVYPAHLNPEVQRQVHELLNGLPNVFVRPPVDYPTMLRLMRQAHLILTDSGGIQEEAPSLRVPVLVMRDRTERAEGIEAGGSVLVGTDRQRIIESATRLLTDGEAHARMQMSTNPYGDGRASQRIVEAIARYLDPVSRLQPCS